MQNPFSWSYLDASMAFTPIWGPLSIAFVSICGVGLVASILVYYNIFGLARRNRLLTKTIEHGTEISTVLFGLGLFFFLFRLTHVALLTFEKRFWLYLVTLGLLIEIAYFVYFAAFVYPARKRAYAADQLKRRYLRPAAAGNSGGSRRRSRNSRKRKNRAATVR